MKKYLHKRPTIGVLAGWQLYPRDIHRFLHLVLSGIHSAAQERDCNLLLACGIGHSGDQSHIHPAWPLISQDTDFVPVGPWNTDGLLVINPLTSTPTHYIQQVMAEGHPVVFVGPNETGTRIVPDNKSGIRQAVAHLAQHGHRRIAFIAGHEDNLDIDSIERLQAYKEAVQEYGLEADSNLIIYGYQDFTISQRSMKQFLNSGVQFNAILASNDSSAIGAIHSIREAGIRIPQDIAVIGFDDWPDATGQDPPLTTVHYPIVESGQKAMDLLLDMINGQPQKDEAIQMPVKLIVRESCGCLPINFVASAITPSKIAHEIVESLRSEIFFLSPDEIQTICQQLVDTSTRSVKEGNPALFWSAFQGILKRVEETGDDPHVWHSALTLLEKNVHQLVDVWNESSEQLLAEMIRQARVSISASTRRQYRQYASHIDYTADQVGLLTMHLFSATSERQIYEALTSNLPTIGIQHGAVAFFEPNGEDMVAASRTYLTSSPSNDPILFPSRQFPPPGMFPDDNDKPTTVALFPLIIQGVAEGYVAFETFNLATCVPIVRQLGAAFRSVRLHEEAIEGRRLAEEANYIKSRFLSTVSHELRTPLNLIVGLSNLVLQEETPESPALAPSRRRDLEQIHTNSEHLGRLIRDVLDLATSQAGQLRLELEPLDLLETLRAATEAGEELARQKGLEWKVSVPEGLFMVMGDHTRLRQVLLNLVSNAVKFTESGQIEARVEGREGEVLVSVRDTGLGIAVGEQEIIFDEFRQSERTTARGYGGMGLGLAISRRLVELHGGRLWVQSSGQEGAGSTFYFTLPVLENAELARPASGQKMLLLARQTEGSQPLQERLIEEGFEVELLLVGEHFDRAAQVMAASPSVVVVDDALAAEQGWEILKILKGHPATRQTPVLFYSLSEDGGRGSLLELDYLMKPVAQTDLTRALTQQGLLSEENMGRPRTILVVDDEPGTLALHVRMVQSLSSGYQVLTARNGREALELIQRGLPDLVLLDLMMPEMDGFGVLEAMRAGETTRNIPVVVLTAQVLTEADMARLNRGVAAVLGKGMFSSEETLAHLEDALGRHGKLGSETQRLVRKAMAYLHTHYAEAVTREVIARQIGVSDDYLTSCFGQETGLTPIAYLNRYRINQAKILLASNEKSLTEVALAVGFADIHYFSRLFRRETGVSPSDFRRAAPRQ